MMETLRMVGILLLSWALLGYCDDDSATEEPVEFPEESTDYGRFVMELGSDNFDSTIAENSLILVEFYAPWCGHCKTLAPEYEKAAAMLDPVKIPLAKVDATEHTDLATRFDITGFPSLKVFHDGVPYDYEGNRNAEGIVSYMYKENKPEWAPPINHVLVLTADNFADTVKSSPLILVEFYAPWCGHCKKLEPEYKKAALVLHEKGIQLTTVDATVETSLATEYGVSGFPTLFIFRYGEKYTYNGPRDQNGIVKYMIEQSKPATSEISSKKDFNRILKRDTPPIVLLCSSEMDDHFMELANIGRDSFLHFMHSDSEAMCSEYGMELGTTAIILPYFYRTIDEPWLIPVDLSEADLPQLIISSRPIVAIRTGVTAQAWYSDFPLLVAYLEIDTSKEGEKDFKFWRDKLVKVAHKNPRMTVAMSHENEYQKELASLGISERGSDVSMVIWAGPKEKYIMDEDDDNINEFVEDFFEGDLKPYIRSQPKPRKDKGPIVTVVGSTFQDVVMDTSKNVMIEFYAPWCGHCKQLEPKYKDLGKKFKKNNKVIVAKFDAASNDAPIDFEFSGFPTLFFVKAGTNEIVLYDGDRETKEMASFIKKQLQKKDEL